MNRPVLSILLSIALAPAAAADFQVGLAAYQRGDYATALAEWTPLAEEGLVEAQFNLGLMYFHGRGVEREHEQAARWYRAAAEQDFAQAQFNLADMYEKGLGVEQDYVQAHLWFNLARSQRYRGAKKRRQRVADEMTDREIARAELLYREWKREHRE